MPARHKDEEKVFKAAVKLGSPSEQATYLKEACGDDVGLLNRVQALLRACEEAGNFLETPALALDISLATSPVSEGPGTVIGRYRLLEKIGEGGMAVVYMAEQQEPIRRKVALKIIKLGMDTRQVIARFEAERQALALMDHPSIAKVFDAGATETGRPYFVMELVTGVSITEYCDENSLSTKDRLALFLQVCQAVQHAHQKGIIHRDIKPSNVMVTHHDGQPVPKVIDFGIAKATNQKLTEKTLFTRYAHIIGTPAYMSPEQAELSDLDIDTRSDIYSLGVLLYELLTGTTPFSEEELRKAGYLEMQRVIREQEPVKPSTRIRTALRSMGVPPMSSTGVPPVKAGPRWPCDSMGKMPMLREVRGDLDWIVMKALEKDRARRYETASGLAEDVRRHLEHEPILARGPSTAYRLRKFLRRHRWPAIAALATVAIAGAAVVVLSLWNRDRVQLVEAEGFRHRGILSQAREQYAKADREAALETIRPILGSEHVGPEAQLLQGGILVDNRRFKEAVTTLNGLLNDRPEIAGAAYALLARVLWESGSLDADGFKQFEEYRRQAETVRPQTAEAYFLRAMTAPTVKEQLAALDQALKLDPKHYEARRLRAFTYCASRKYERLNEDALLMEAGRERDPLGYSLRATALRALGRGGDAIAEYDHALALTNKKDPQYFDLTTQRLETLLRQGDYARVLADAREAQTLWPDKAIFRHHLFGALTALGDYDKASAVFEEIVASGPEPRQQFRGWCAAHVFDNLQAGRSWHPPEREPVGPAFLPLKEAKETYRTLCATGRRITADGFSAQWSPDGKTLAFSLGVQGRSGVALFDPATNQTDLLIVPGKYPRWSPDGKYIAFVRDRQFLRVPEFVMADPMSQPRAPADQEVWFMRSDGTEPKRLARGIWASWSKDSTRLYYRSRLDSNLYSISIASENAEPTRIMACSEYNYNPSVSPDSKHVAYTEGTSLKVKAVASGALVAEWPLPLPSEGWSAPAWSADGNELCLGGSGGPENWTGLWVYRLGQSTPAHTLCGPITVGSWGAHGAKLVFELGAPHFEIWTADLPASAPTGTAFGPRRTPEEHFRAMLALCTHRIETDPRDAYAYCTRARYRDYLGERAKADADMKRWSAVMMGRPPSAFWFAARHALRHVLDMPFNCELVFSAERSGSGTTIMSVAFGQKGRCEMKLLEIPLSVAAMFSLGALVGLDAPPAHADFTFGKPVDMKTVIPAIDWRHDAALILSYDGLEMYLDSDRPGCYGLVDLWVLRRDSPDAPWGPVENLGPVVNAPAPAWENAPSISADGLTLYFCSNRSGGQGSVDLYVTSRATKKDPWGPPVNLGPKVNSSSFESCPSIASDGLELYFQSNRPGGYGGFDVYVSRRATANGPWGDAVNLGPVVNSAFNDTGLCLSPDGRLLLVQDYGTPRPGGYGGGDLWMTWRASPSNAWGPPVNLGPAINGPGMEASARISPDGSTLYFAAASGDSGVTWQASISPVVDFNADGKVDAADTAILMADWGKNDSVCDIGPFAWGDGVVDEKDLKVFMEAVVKPTPKASDVPCDMSLSWVAAPSAKSDVYLGTSVEAVTSASRSNPQAVLVSQGQTATTYAPPALLDFGRTYYWRIDQVIGTGNPMIYQGPVLSFTTEAFAHPIKNIIATASSAKAAMGAEKTMDGSGLDKSDGHSTNATDMWLSVGKPAWIQYQFDKVYALHELWVWNSNSMMEPDMGLGAKTVKIEYSADGTQWTQLTNVPEFARATGQDGYVHNTTVSFGGVSAKYVKLKIEKNWGVAQPTGLSEVRFFYIPDRPATKP